MSPKERTSSDLAPASSSSSSSSPSSSNANANNNHNNNPAAWWTQLPSSGAPIVSGDEDDNGGGGGGGGGGGASPEYVVAATATASSSPVYTAAAASSRSAVAVVVADRRRPDALNDNVDDDNDSEPVAASLESKVKVKMEAEAEAEAANKAREMAAKAAAAALGIAAAPSQSQSQSPTSPSSLSAGACGRRRTALSGAQKHERTRLEEAVRAGERAAAAALGLDESAIGGRGSPSAASVAAAAAAASASSITAAADALAAPSSPAPAFALAAATPPRDPSAPVHAVAFAAPTAPLSCSYSSYSNSSPPHNSSFSASAATRPAAHVAVAPTVRPSELRAREAARLLEEERERARRELLGRYAALSSSSSSTAPHRLTSITVVVPAPSPAPPIVALNSRGLALPGDDSDDDDDGQDDSDDDSSSDDDDGYLNTHGKVQRQEQTQQQHRVSDIRARSVPAADKKGGEGRVRVEEEKKEENNHRRDRLADGKSSNVVDGGAGESGATFPPARVQSPVSSSSSAVAVAAAVTTKSKSNEEREEEEEEGGRLWMMAGSLASEGSLRRATSDEDENGEISIDDDDDDNDEDEDDDDDDDYDASDEDKYEHNYEGRGVRGVVANKKGAIVAGGRDDILGRSELSPRSSLSSSSWCDRGRGRGRGGGAEEESVGGGGGGGAKSSSSPANPPPASILRNSRLGGPGYGGYGEGLYDENGHHHNHRMMEGVDMSHGRGTNKKVGGEAGRGGRRCPPSSLLAKTRSRAAVDGLATGSDAGPIASAQLGAERGSVSASHDGRSWGGDGSYGSGGKNGEWRGSGGTVHPYEMYMGADAAGRIDPPDLMPEGKLARKRVKVVQLLVFGLFGIAAGFFGSMYVQFTCHFVTGYIPPTATSGDFYAHFGMWKYTPMDSIFQDYAYCATYDTEYTLDAPVVARTGGLIALICGTYAMSVLWVYLVLGICATELWTLAVRCLAISGVCQSLTFLIFAGTVCQRDACSFGPGAAASLLATVTWFVLCYEMHHNSPIVAAMLPVSAVVGGGSIVSVLSGGGDGVGTGAGPMAKCRSAIPPSTDLPPDVRDALDKSGLRGPYDKYLAGDGGRSRMSRDVPSLARVAQRNQMHRGGGVLDGGYRPPGTLAGGSSTSRGGYEFSSQV